MSIGTWVALLLLLAVATAYYFISERGGEILATGDMTLAQAIVILLRKHSIAYVGAGSMFVSDIRLQVLNSA